MSDANLATAASNDTSRGEEDEEAGQGSPGLSGSSMSNGDWKKPSSRERGSRGPQVSNSDDTDAQSSGNDSAERECEGHMGRDASTCSSHNGKDSVMETTESKSSNSQSSNSQSPSPPSSSVAYSLLSGSSEQDHPSTSGCSSDRPARLQTQKELLKALRELKIRVPADHRGKGRSSTLASLQYALNCVKQVRANQEYYHQWSVEETHGCCLDLSAFTMEELDNITSEYTLQNTDTFSVAVSFLSGKVVYISPQACCLLHCKPERLQGVLFSELLAPQDVSTFYSSTAPSRLPAWGSCSNTASPMDCAQEKSMFCRISGGRESEGDGKYYPFRLVPYQLTLRACDKAQPQPCCLLIAERVHSGYEAPRIPADKRIFTTSHTPSCLFQEVDERAVPLLGYLPQDLVGTPMLLYLHPEDRPVMVAIHKKILQFAGQPFEDSPLRMCARSGEYLTIDTSWSSFINPWSRKVAFIVGRHKVRTSPLNEDVFTPPEGVETRSMSPEIPQLSEQIHRLLVQPVHGGGSQGYSSLGSNASPEQQPSAGSSSESNGPAPEDRIQAHKPMTFQQMCKDVHMVKTNGQQVFIESRNRPPLRKYGSSALLHKHGSTGALVTLKTAAMEQATRPALQQVIAIPPPKTLASPQLPREEQPTTYSYQQINCLDSVIRYLESCNIPNTVKRKCGSSSCSTSDDDRQRAAKDIAETLGVSEGAKVGPPGPAHRLTPLALHCKAESVVSVTSQCSFSSTIVHVGDKKPRESDIVMEEAPLTPTTAPPTSTTPLTPRPATCASPFVPLEKEGRRGGRGTRLGLTKEVLSAHMQQEEQVFLSRFRDLSQLHVLQPGLAPSRRQATTPPGKGVRCSQDYLPGGSSGRRRGRGGKRLKHQQEGGSQRGSYPGGLPLPSHNMAVSGPGPAELPGPPAFPSGRHLSPQTSSSSWPTSVDSQASTPPSVPAYPPGCLPFYPLYPPLSQQLLPHLGADLAGQAGYSSGPAGCPSFQMQTSPLMPPMVPPVMAFILPNYMFPQLGGAVPQMNLGSGQLGVPMPHLSLAMPHLSPAMPHLSPALPLPLPPLNPAVPLNPMAQYNATIAHMHMQCNAPLSTTVGQLSAPAMTQIPQPFNSANPLLTFPSSLPVPAAAAASVLPSSLAPRGASRSSTPQSSSAPRGEREGAESPLFQSRCSSPLNLLQLEEPPSNRPEGAAAGAQQTPPPPGGVGQDWTGKQGDGIGGGTPVSLSSAKDAKVNDDAEANESNQDAMSTSSDLLDLLLQEDSRSGTGSAASGSGSLGSGSNGCTSGSGTSGTRSSNTSKYFGSIDSSENYHSHKQVSSGIAGEEQFMKYVLQDPIWLLMANTDDKVMMTYQLPSRDRNTVLREDRAILKTVQKQQPRFTDEQKRELSQVHPWMRTGRLPKAINIPSCTECGFPPDTPVATPFDMELHDMDLTLTGVLQLPEVLGAPDAAAALTPCIPSPRPSPTITKAEGDDDGNSQDMIVDEAEVTSAAEVKAEDG